MADKSYNQNVGNKWVCSVPLFWSILAITTIVTFSLFFSFHSPNPYLLTILPNLPTLQSIQDPIPPKLHSKHSPLPHEPNPPIETQSPLKSDSKQSQSTPTPPNEKQSPLPDEATPPKSDSKQSEFQFPDDPTPPKEERSPLPHEPTPPNSDSKQSQSQSQFPNDPTPPKEKQGCDLWKGQWVQDQRSAELYTNWSCPTIQESKNCFKQGRKDTGFVNWRWKPHQCELPRFDSMAFLRLLRGKTIAFIGDSVSRNHFDSLLCFLSQVETPQDVYKDSEDRFRTWYFPKSNLTLMMLWSKFLVAGEERLTNGTGTGIFDLHFDKVDDSWARHLPDIDYAIISNGHWFFRVLYLHEGNKMTNCIYCSDPKVTNHNPDYALRMAFRAAFKYMNDCKNCGKLVTFVRTFSPAHFENGVWNTGGSCNRTKPLSKKEINLESYDWKLRDVEIEEMKKAKQDGAMTGKRFEAIDVTMAMTMRADGHPGEFTGNIWMKGYSDCVHWCMPGPIDVWNDFLMAVIRKEPAIDS